MPTVPHPDPRHPVVWADTPGVPDATSTPAISGLPDDGDPIQFNLDEALVRKADNDTVHRWKALAGRVMLGDFQNSSFKEVIRPFRNL